MNKELSVNDKLDILELEMSEYPISKCPLSHTLTDDQYVREIFMPAGNIITSKIHKTRHPYLVLRGVVSVWTERDGWQTIEAPYYGVTEPGTRRLLYIHEDCNWVTVHARINGETVDQIEERIIEKHDNPFLPEQIKKAFAEISRYGLEEVNENDLIN